MGKVRMKIRNIRRIKCNSQILIPAPYRRGGSKVKKYANHENYCKHRFNLFHF
jgi:hypothetical protein